MTGMSGARPAPFFIGDSAGLDFLNSIATPVDQPVEWLATGADLLDWLADAKLVPGEVLASFKATTMPGELDAVAAQARALREWFRGFVQDHKGKVLKPSALQELAPLNRLLERDDEYIQVIKRGRHDPPGNSGLIVRSVRRWRSPETLLLPIAKAISELVTNEDFSYVKACEGPTCTLLFLDKTHSRARRWCSMAACGNRAKQAAHRQRLRESNR
jgi:predicted RNA-binding Zn ribbon-like protein